MQTREQRYAAKIYRQVEQVAKEDRTAYGSMAHKLPVLVRTAGLAQALAFVVARGSKPHLDLVQHLAEVTGRDTQTLLKDSRELPLVGYMRLTQEVLAALIWYKRFAESVLEVTSDVDTGVSP